jgi:hypothetical protein
MRQANPDACSIAGYRGLIASALRVTSADNLALLIRWVYESNDPGPAWLRGSNPNGRVYLGLENILVVSKIPSRVQLALEWDPRRARPHDGHNGAAVVELGDSTTANQRSRIMHRWMRRVNGAAPGDEG